MKIARDDLLASLFGCSLTTHDCSLKAVESGFVVDLHSVDLGVSDLSTNVKILRPGNTWPLEVGSGRRCLKLLVILHRKISSMFTHQG